MKILERAEHAMTSKWRLIMSHKWNKSKKSSLEAWILDVSQAFHLFSFLRAHSMRESSFNSFLRGLSSYYDMKGSLRYLAVEVLEDAEMGKNGHFVKNKHRLTCHTNGTRTRNAHLLVAAVPLWRIHLSCNSSPLIIRINMNRTGAAFGDGTDSCGENASGNKGTEAAMKSDSFPSSHGRSDKQEEVQSKTSRSSAFDCLASLEASHPMKRGLSSSYEGKSKSFINLSELGIEDVKDLGKKVHITNKRRRLLISHEYHYHNKCHDLHGATSTSTIPQSSSMPSFPTLVL